MDDIEKVKRMVFKYWDKMGPEIDSFLYNIVNNDVPMWVISRWLIEWYGGKDEINKELSKYKNKVYKANAAHMGTYDFHFYISGIELLSDKIMYVAVVDGSGECYINVEQKIYTEIYPAFKDIDIGWEVGNELEEIINETLENMIGINLEFYCTELKVKRKF